MAKTPKRTKTATLVIAQPEEPVRQIRMSFQSFRVGLKGQLRDAIRHSGKSLQELGRVSGIGADRLSRFVREERGISLDAAERLCDILTLRLFPCLVVSRQDFRRPAKSKS